MDSEYFGSASIAAFERVMELDPYYRDYAVEHEGYSCLDDILEFGDPTNMFWLCDDDLAYLLDEIWDVATHAYLEDLT